MFNFLKKLNRIGSSSKETTVMETPIIRRGGVLTRDLQTLWNFIQNIVHLYVWVYYFGPINLNRIYKILQEKRSLLWNLKTRHCIYLGNSYIRVFGGWIGLPLRFFPLLKIFFSNLWDSMGFAITELNIEGIESGACIQRRLEIKERSFSVSWSYIAVSTIQIWPEFF